MQFDRYSSFRSVGGARGTLSVCKIEQLHFMHSNIGKYSTSPEAHSVGNASQAALKDVAFNWPPRLRIQNHGR